MLEHFFVGCDGTLHDTRAPEWHRIPLRQNFMRTHAEIRTLADFKATLRAGAYAWPGGYPMYLICSDGGALCFPCARKEARSIMWSIDNKAGDGWRVVACDINYEDAHLHCEHCGEKIELAYAE